MHGENEEEIKTFTKEEMTQRINEARAQAAREGKKTVLESLGFENTDALKTFIEDARAAREAAESENASGNCKSVKPCWRSVRLKPPRKR